MKNSSKKNILRIITLTALIFTLSMLGACSKNGELTIKDSDTSGVSTAGTDKTSEKDSQTTSENADTTPETDNSPPDETTSTTAETTKEQVQTTSPIMSETSPNDITLTAQGLLGIPFVQGGQSPDVGFDSSGFIYYVLKENGYVNVSRSIGEQAAMGELINLPSDLKSGDLVFFSSDNTKAQFGGIYIGDGIMISCSMPGDVVKEIAITSGYYIANFYTGVRIL